jgi:anaphase-promoting complex subunit 2
LHPGAQTNQILQVYMNTIKVLRIIDPTDCLLEHVSHGVKSYLRERGDTVRCIISSLTDEEALGGDLYEELQRQDDVRPLEEARYDSDEEEEMPGWDWSPTPSLYYQRTSGSVNVDDEEGMASRDGTTEKAADLLSMLVGIYGSNDLFVDEYRLMLADKLLANIDFDTDREVHNLELLKKRFSESCMRQCEIMIKDMDDSKRIAANIHSTIRGRSMEEENNVVVDVAIVSHIFWPPLQKDSMKNHPRIQA